MPFCVKCGKIANDEDNYCTKCGKKLVKEEIKNRKEFSYLLPSITLLDLPKRINRVELEEEIKQNIGKLEKALIEYGVIAKVTEVHIGPSITIYELEMKPGTKISEISNIKNELALALSVSDIDVAPISGKSTVGIEIPNKVKSIVTFREVISSFPKHRFNNKLMVAIGKDMIGNPTYCEINYAPHILIAGSTGTGKSVFINTIIASILMKALPSEVKLLLIDTKAVEMNIFNGLPHLLQPVISNTIKANISLQRVVAEMMDRFDKFEDSNVRNIESYNDYILKKNKTLPDESKLPLLPYIVVIIDDVANLNLDINIEIKDSISRLTKMGNSAGIHLIISTQRPSSNVIDGDIKSSIKTRISFALPSKTDSKVILDMEGAEKLSGRGEMLFLTMGETIPKRIQGAFVSEEEIQKIVNFICNQYENCNDVIISSENLDVSNNKSNKDPLYGEVVDFVISTGKVSASLIQRRFKIGYNRAAKLVDELEKNGIVGSQKESTPRKVLVELSDK